MMNVGLKHFPPSEHLSHPSHARPGIHAFPDRLHVVTMVSNPLRWRSRYANYWKFAKHVEDAGALLYTCEIAFGDREFEITEAGNPHHLQLRTDDEIWHKENAHNLTVAQLPKDWKYVACIDADMAFGRTDWAQETLHLLQHYSVLQMYSHLADLGPHGEPVNRNAISIAHLRATELSRLPHEADITKADGYYQDLGQAAKWQWGCPGLAWAYRRSAWEALGGMMDWIISGSADWYMAKALYGEIEDVLKPRYSENYKVRARHWQDRALRHIKKNIGCMTGLAVHHWHGAKMKRGYEFRPNFMVKTQFDPFRHISRDWQGLYQLDPDAIEIRDGLRQYARMRDEDQNSICS